MRRGLLLLLMVALAAGCAVTEARPVYRAIRGAGDIPRVLVVGVDRSGANRAPVDALGREVAFALSQRGRPALDFPAFEAAVRAVGRPLPDAVVDRLLAGTDDATVDTYLQSEGLQTLVLVEIPIAEQVWSANGKRTRVSLTARGRDVATGEVIWRAYASPEVDHAPGVGFRLATDLAVGALIRAISGEPEPPAVPSLAPALNALQWW
jgi:hypothetical protein